MPASRLSKTAAARTPEPETSRERVIRAAIETFARQGFNGTGIRDIASAAGLTTASLYHYMGNKDDLLVEIMARTIAPLNGGAARVTAEVKDAASRLAIIVEQHVWCHASDRLATLVTDTEVRALSGARRTRVVALRDQYEGHWRSAIRYGLKQGTFEVNDPDTAARALLQMSTGVSHWFSGRGKLTLEVLCREYSDWALSLVRARNSRGPIRRDDLELPAPTHYLAAEVPPVTSR